jgi:hypothetical protein
MKSRLGMGSNPRRLVLLKEKREDVAFSSRKPVAALTAQVALNLS